MTIGFVPVARQKISMDQLAIEALAVVDSLGFDAVTLAVVADRLGVRSSALYTHVDGVDGLRCVVATESTRSLTGALRTATIGRARADAVLGLGHAYRDFALEWPGRYMGTQFTPARPPAELVQARSELDEVFELVVAGYGASTDPAHAAHTARAAICGFVVLEHRTPFADTSSAGTHFDHLLEMVVASLA